MITNLTPNPNKIMPNKNINEEYLSLISNDPPVIMSDQPKNKTINAEIAHNIKANVLYS
jgi:hypothetical protein